jgi:hypothetical protein
MNNLRGQPGEIEEVSGRMCVLMTADKNKEGGGKGLLMGVTAVGVLIEPYSAVPLNNAYQVKLSIDNIKTG